MGALAELAASIRRTPPQLRPLIGLPILFFLMIPVGLVLRLTGVTASHDKSPAEVVAGLLANPCRPSNLEMDVNVTFEGIRSVDAQGWCTHDSPDVTGRIEDVQTRYATNNPTQATVEGTVVIGTHTYRSVVFELRRGRPGWLVDAVIG